MKNSPMGKTLLPPGFRFHPTDVELVKYYLKRKVLGKRIGFQAIDEVEIYKHAPWDLPEKSLLKSGDLKWYFFCPMKKKYGKGSQFNRATKYGYWKTTGNNRVVRHNAKVVGMVKTLVFYRGKAPRGERTDWVMHEYRLEDDDLSDKGIVLDSYVLCVVFQKDGPGHRNRAQYGAPFKEEDWSDDEDVNFVEAASSVVMPRPVLPHTLCLESPAESSGFVNTLPPVKDCTSNTEKESPLESSDFDTLPQLEEECAFSTEKEYATSMANATDHIPEFLETTDFSVDEIQSFFATFTEDDMLGELGNFIW